MAVRNNKDCLGRTVAIQPYLYLNLFFCKHTNIIVNMYKNCVDIIVFVLVGVVRGRYILMYYKLVNIQ